MNWVIVLRPSAAFDYQVLDTTLPRRRTRFVLAANLLLSFVPWTRIVGAVNKACFHS